MSQQDHATSFDISKIRTQFPVLERQVHGKPLAYLDNAATTQKPQVMLDAWRDYMTQHNANVHRGVHQLGDESTQAWHTAREQIAHFFGATADELILTANTTTAMNQLAQMMGEQLAPGDVVVATQLDHHSNFVPWQRAAQEAQAEWAVLPVDASGQLDMPAAKEQLYTHKDRLRVLTVPLVSNVLGNNVDVAAVVQWLKDWKIRDQVFVVVDAAQAAAHMPVSLHDLGVDALVWSGHKIYGPMGVGGAVVRRTWLEQFVPSVTGGGMIATVSEATTTYALDLADKFTPGTPNVAGAVALAASLQWLKNIGWSEIAAHEHSLVSQLYDGLQEIPDITVVGPSPESRLGSVAWLYQDIHAHEVAQYLDHQGIAVRSGHHCAMPLHTKFAWPATVRASFGVYNTTEEVSRLLQALQEMGKVFA